MWRFLSVLCFVLIVAVEPAAAQSQSDILGAPHRELSAHRDQYRHPLETMAFFDV